ncbi:MAG TPA: RNA polymerase sigma-70 factor [Chryseosolibacter sp.]|jgi:RNA polymerase sigma factor, sigma-70 family/RNA polymerase sigma-70 factor, Bacteroides expansion family 1
MTLSRGYQEGELIDLLVTGDRKAFEIIYQTHAAALINYAQKSILTKEDCEGIVQEVFECLWEKHQTLAHLTCLRGYLFKMVRFKIVDRIRHSLVRKKYEMHYRAFDARLDYLNEVSNDPAEIQALINTSISRLPERCQVAFRLRFDENLSYKDIAFQMNISTKTVEKHISAGLHHLRKVCKNSSDGLTG